ncbi:MAG TPA: sigma-70 family RNA polymerase sigma factor [Conexibacter sp.]|jgi:RNA polymerase sigma factor (sigma-70 family)
MGGLSRRRDGGAEDVVLGLVREHAAELLRFARRFSLSGDDAQDAYQRALEIMVLQLRRGPIDRPLSYLRTIIRHEAGRVRIERERMLGRDELDIERQRSDTVADPAEHAERFERLAHAAEALRRLKPQELTALSLRAEGLSYNEICERLNWSYTRCNRAITEGRRALLARLKAIESGAECERWLPLLSTLADGEATAVQLAELRPHLRSCSGCRATLRCFHQAPTQLRAIMPPALALPAAAAAAGSGGGLWRHGEALVHGALERLSLGALRLHGALEALPGAKVAAVAASTVAVAGGGAAIQHVAKGHHDKPRAEAAAGAASGAGATATHDVSMGLSGGLAVTPPPIKAPSGSAQPAAATAAAGRPGSGQAEWALAGTAVEWAVAQATEAAAIGEFAPHGIAPAVAGATSAAGSHRHGRVIAADHDGSASEFDRGATTAEPSPPPTSPPAAQPAAQPATPPAASPPAPSAPPAAPEYRPDHAAEFGGH